MNRLASFACLAALLLAGPPPVSAQTPSGYDVSQSVVSEPPAHISVVDGTASLVRNGHPDPAPLSMPLLSGDRLRTENGRVEVLFGDGATLHLDTGSTVDFQSDDVLRLLDGRIRLTIPGSSRVVSYRVDSPSGWVQIREPGEYRIAIAHAGGNVGDVELAVLRGAADLVNEEGQTSLRAGERAFARAGTAPSYPYVYNSAAWDDFDRWSDQQRAQSAGVSSQYLPDTVRGYATTLDQSGSWSYDASYGYVWYPVVSTGWRPYWHGRWLRYPGFGWTWIGNDRWTWVTHHYGRWGFSGNAWFWIPGRTWGPAWVSWAYAPGYVSWCPLGWDNRAAVAFGVSASYYRGRRYDGWNAWTVVPSQRFGVGYVNANVVSGARLTPEARTAFVQRPAAPDGGRAGYAVPRNSAPIYAAGSGRRPGGFGAAPAPSRGFDPGSRAATAAIAPRSRVTTTADEAAATLRSRRPSVESTPGAGYPAPARAPRNSADVVERMGAQRPAPSRAADVSNIPVHRGTVPGQVDPNAPRPDDGRRLDVPGYRRVPPAPQSTPGGYANQRSLPSYEAAPAVRPNDAPYRASPSYQQPGGAYRAVPRQPNAPAMPGYPSYGGNDRSPNVIEHRGTPMASPSATPPPREQGPPPAAGSPPPGGGQAVPRGSSGAPRGGESGGASRGGGGSPGAPAGSASPSGGGAPRGGAARGRG